MIALIYFIRKGFLFLLISFFICFSSLSQLSAEEINWIEVANINNKIQFIDANSINYNNRGFLSVMTKYNELNPEDQEIINSNSYLIAVDCENRLFSKIKMNSELKQVKNWETPINDKLIKKTILTSCSY